MVPDQILSLPYIVGTYDLMLRLGSAYAVVRAVYLSHKDIDSDRYTFSLRLTKLRYFIVYEA